MHIYNPLFPSLHIKVLSSTLGDLKADRPPPTAHRPGDVGSELQGFNKTEPMEIGGIWVNYMVNIWLIYG